MHKIEHHLRYPLHSMEVTRDVEAAAQADLPAHTLMQRAGLAVAQLALAIAPHARRIWVACGPGNNGGDGLEAAMHLQRWGKSPIVTWLGNPEQAPPDAAWAHQRAMNAGVVFAHEPPADPDLCVDALLGIGANLREPQGHMAEWINLMNARTTPVLAVDIPTGLQANTGQMAQLSVRATHTLSLLTLKPGLFTAHGRDLAGTVWLDDLSAGDSPQAGRLLESPSAWRAGAAPKAPRLHASHKGTFGDVAVIGGATGMTGAALLAASAALHSGAGRVFVGLLDGGSLSVDTSQPELMFRPVETLDLSAMTVVCGCGGGDNMTEIIFKAISAAAGMLLDADALNSIAKSAPLQAALQARAAHHATTVLTPHPLEAARLLGCTVTQLQNDRLAAARELAQRLACTVVLKGSGTVIAAPGHTSVINPTGNARLSTAGTGDVLAGMVGARLAGGWPVFEAACQAVYEHGLAADQWPDTLPLTAGTLARHLPIHQ